MEIYFWNIEDSIGKRKSKGWKKGTLSRFMQKVLGLKKQTLVVYKQR